MFIFIVCVFVEVVIMFGNNVCPKYNENVLCSQISKRKRKKRKEDVENEINPFESLIRMTFLKMQNKNINFLGEDKRLKHSFIGRQL